jgi:hypothetical protein
LRKQIIEEHQNRINEIKTELDKFRKQKRFAYENDYDYGLAVVENCVFDLNTEKNNKKVVRRKRFQLKHLDFVFQSYINELRERGATTNPARGGHFLYSINISIFVVIVIQSSLNCSPNANILAHCRDRPQIVVFVNKTVE